MSSHHNFFTVDFSEMQKLLASRDPGLAQRAIERAAEEFSWDMGNRSEFEPLFAAAKKVIEDGQWECEYCGMIYYTLMQLCDHEQVSDGWKAHYTEDVVEFLRTTSLSAKSQEIFAGLIRGRGPDFKLQDRECDDVVACFIGAEEARAFLDEVDNCPELAPGKVPDPSVEEIFFNDFLPALDREMRDGQCIVAFVL